MNRQVRSGWSSELAGPAEGQYRTVFEDSVATNTLPDTAPCTDVFEFILASPTDRLCLGLSVPAPLAEGSMQYTIWSWVRCEYIGWWELDTGMASVEDCIDNLEAGKYAVFVSGILLSPLPAPYTLTIDASAPTVTGAVDRFEDECGIVPLCGVEGAPPYRR